MRKEIKTKTAKQVNSNLRQCYHQTTSSLTNYAFQGFEKNLYFTSDRTKELDANFRLASGQPLKGFGLEIEVESDYLCNGNALAFSLKNLAFTELPANLFKFQSDGSLCGGNSSIEAITQVMTKEFIRNNYYGFKYMYEVFGVYGISASRSGNCGMHCNMSVGMFGRDYQTQQQAIMKFVYFVNKHYDLACDLFKRGRDCTDYCRRMYGFDNKDFCKSYDLRLTSEHNSNHGICWNLAHFNTGRVELRLVGGQPNYAGFRNTMEVIFHLVKACGNLSWDALDNPVKVFTGCNKYVLSRLADCATSTARRTASLTQEQYNQIKDLADMTVDFGNF